VRVSDKNPSSEEEVARGLEGAVEARFSGSKMISVYVLFFIRKKKIITFNYTFWIFSCVHTR
jgi:hypothetical protein